MIWQVLLGPITGDILLMYSDKNHPQGSWLIALVIVVSPRFPVYPISDWMIPPLTNQWPYIPSDPPSIHGNYKYMGYDMGLSENRVYSQL